ncbi:MAG: helix-turn-helix domain-containing protein [Lachnospiraceae bacterium]|nr:helix-turn-helix domain-containing protein [Lachnospiraceae bacterium]
MKKIQDTIRKNIKETRKKRGYTQKDLAAVLNTSLSAYQKFEQGKRNISLEHIVAISNFLNVELPSLLRLQTKKEDILNQDELSRKEFLRELLKTFGIGAYPQREYSSRDISALLSFIRAYGHSVPYSPNKIKHNIIFSGYASSDIVEKMERFEETLQNGLPKQYQKIENLEKKIEEQLTQLKRLDQKIDARCDEIIELEKEMEERKNTISTLSKEQSQLDKNILIKQKTLNEIMHKLENHVALPQNEFISASELIELQEKCISLEIQNNKLKKSLKHYISQYNELSSKLSNMEDDDEYCYTEEDMEELIADYHNLSSGDLEDIVFLLLMYAQAFEKLTTKYKTAPKDLYKYTKVPSRILEGVDYSSLTSIEYISDFIKWNIAWEINYG